MLNAMAKYKTVSKDLLYDLYITQRLPRNQILKHLGISSKVLRTALCYHGISKKDTAIYKTIPRDYLYDLYITENLSQAQIAERLGVSSCVVQRALEYRNIKKEILYQAISKEYLYDLYIRQNLSVSEVATILNTSVSTVCKSAKYHGIVKDGELVVTGRRKTCLKKYGKENFCQTDIMKEKTKKTCQIRYGVDHICQSAHIKRKIKQTFQKKYGVDHPMRCADIRDKIKQTNLHRYCVENAFQVKEFQDKSKQTNKERYGVENVAQSCAIKSKVRQTNLQRYGAGCSLLNPAVNRKARQTCLERYGAEHHEQQDKSQQQILVTKDEDLFERFLISVQEIMQRKPTSFEVAKMLNYSHAYVCALLKRLDFYKYVERFRSQPEIELCSLFPTDYTNIKNAVKGHELDLYYPEQKLAIEFNGLFWHSSPRLEQNYHYNKYLACQESGIRLIQIFEDEWEFTRDIVVDKLSHIFGGSADKPVVGARKCAVQSVEPSIARGFMVKNHIQGFCRGRHIGLFYADMPVAVVTVNKSQLSREGSSPQEGLEISRFATDITKSVPGAFTKLVNYLLTMTNRLYSYADLRWVDPNNNIYLNHGFQSYGIVEPAYWYWTDMVHVGFDTGRRYYRFNFTKKKIRQNFGEFLPPESRDWTEKEMTECLGWYRIYDAGKISYELLKK